MRHSTQSALFEQWLSEHKGIMVRIARSFAAGQEDQVDLLQEIQFQVWQSVPRFNGEAKASTWIYRVALNTAMAWRRTENRRRKSQEHGGKPEAPGHGAELEQRELVEGIYDCIRQLPVIDCCLVLLHLEELSYREIAGILGISESNVGVRLNRVKKRLATMMEEAGYGL